jgi:hypothetical protein
MGFKLVAYPLSLLGVSIRAMERALTGLKAGVVPDVRDTGTFVDIQMAVGFPVSAATVKVAVYKAVLSVRRCVCELMGLRSGVVPDMRYASTCWRHSVVLGGLAAGIPVSALLCRHWAVQRTHV